MSQYLFIDGALFEQLFAPMVKNIFPEENLFTAIDLRELANAYDRVFYYDALPAKKPSETLANWEARRTDKEALFNKLSMTPNIHVRSGESRFRRRRGLEQKGVDILLAIEALQHAVLGNIDTACFILSDLDFYPLFDALVQTRVKSRLYYDPHNTSRELIYAADISEALNAGILNNWLRNDLVTQTNITRRGGGVLLVDAQTVKCGGRTIVIGKHEPYGYCAYYEDEAKSAQSANYLCGKIPYMLLSVFEDAPGHKVTGAENFGFR